jgi:DNA invertase Pin-like site-specific DNA recombinase
MMIIGYVRVSTTDQDLTIQETALRAVWCEIVRAEKRSSRASSRARGLFL